MDSIQFDDEQWCKKSCDKTSKIYSKTGRWRRNEKLEGWTDATNFGKNRACCENRSWRSQNLNYRNVIWKMYIQKGEAIVFYF